MVSWGFQRMCNEWCVYHQVSSTGTTIFAVHVDNIMVTSSSIDETLCFRDELHLKWEISELGPASFTLRIAISRNRSHKTISLSQTAFINHTIECFNQTNSHPTKTPIVTSSHLTHPDKSMPISADTIHWMKHTPYRKLISSLNYLAVTTQPDIAYTIGRLASFLDCY